MIPSRRCSLASDWIRVVLMKPEKLSVATTASFLLYLAEVTLVGYVIDDLVLVEDEKLCVHHLFELKGSWMFQVQVESIQDASANTFRDDNEVFAGESSAHLLGDQEAIFRDGNFGLVLQIAFD